ncbi:hypothetical protein ACOMHN_048094 [Nucella lapillus]
MLPIILCYALSIHKLQGSTLDKVILNASLKEFALGLLFVGASRVKRFEDLTFEPFPNFERFPQIAKCTSLKERLQEEERMKKQEENTITLLQVSLEDVQQAAKVHAESINQPQEYPAKSSSMPVDIQCACAMDEIEEMEVIEDITSSPEVLELSVDQPCQDLTRSLIVLKGIDNLGNTCFMNCNLQCLFHVNTVSEYFCNQESFPDGIAKQFAILLSKYWFCPQRTLHPTELKNAIDMLHNGFREHSQHDAHEFLMFLRAQLDEHAPMIAPTYNEAGKGMPAGVGVRSGITEPFGDSEVKVFRIKELYRLLRFNSVWNVPHPDLQSAVGNAPLLSKHPTHLPTTDCLLSITPLMGGQPSDATALSPPSPLQQGGQSSNAPALSPPSPLPQGGQPIALALSPSSPPPQDGQPSDAPGLSPSSSTLLLCPSDSTLSICHLNSQSAVKTGITLDGKHVPAKPLTPDFDRKRVTRAYLTTLEGSGLLHKDAAAGFSLDRFTKGYALFCFDLTPSLVDGDQFELVKSAPMRLELKFAKALPNPVVVLVYGELDGLIEVNKSRQVLTDFAV